MKDQASCPRLAQAEPSTEGGKALIDCIGPSEKCSDCPLRDSDCQIAWFGQEPDRFNSFQRRRALKDLLGD